MWPASTPSTGMSTSNISSTICLPYLRSRPRICSSRFRWTPRAGRCWQVASPVDIGAAPSNVWLAPDPSGKYLYVGPVGSNGVAAYGIDPADGTLTPVSGSPFAAASGPSAAAVDPYGKYLYVTNSNSNDISAYAIDPDSGALAPIAGLPFPTGSEPSSIAVEPLGHFADAGYALGCPYTKSTPDSGALTPTILLIFLIRVG